MDTKYDTLVLSGSSVSAFVTLGAIQYAYDNSLLNCINTYIGTSSGAIISFLLIIGYTPIEIVVFICKHQIMEKMNSYDFISMVKGKGTMSFDIIRHHIEKMINDKIGYIPTLDDIYKKYNKKLICVTYNITKNHVEYLSCENYPLLSCTDALQMSSNLPLLFENFKYDDSMYIDGGISDNFAIDIGEMYGEYILGIILDNFLPENFPDEHDINMKEFIFKLLFIPVRQYVNHKIRNISDKCKVIRLTNDKTKFFQFNISSSRKLDMFSNGYDQMKSKLIPDLI